MIGTKPRGLDTRNIVAQMGDYDCAMKHLLISAKLKQSRRACRSSDSALCLVHLAATFKALANSCHYFSATTFKLAVFYPGEYCR
mmetsp:Transcript_24983/g.59363  ORF Transcript_24983/g.59363 Transcript_24983/m.59363 type:complete len:85 (+) Transcript_24983:154-408(+)